MRHEKQAPVQRMPMYSFHLQKWLRENDRTQLAVYSPGYSAQRDPNHRGVVTANLNSGDY